MVPITLLQTALFAATLTGQVVAVADGDTLTVLTPEKRQMRVRLAEVDAPEKTQAFGQKAKQALSRRMFGRAVRVDVLSTDRVRVRKTATGIMEGCCKGLDHGEARCQVASAEC
jgi:endonuclease YncB( thermonuclease family)